MADKAEGTKQEPKDAPAPAKKDAALSDGQLEQVNELLAKAIVELEAKYATILEEKLADVQTNVNKGLEDVLDKLLARVEEGALGAAGGLSAEVKRELHWLAGQVENVATTVERSIGRPVNRNVAVLSLEDAADATGPAEAVAAGKEPASSSSAGPDTVESLGL